MLQTQKNLVNARFVVDFKSVLWYNGIILIRGESMCVEYKKLWVLLIQKGITKPQFRELAGLSPATLTKLNKNEYVSMEVLTKICQALHCNIGDIVDIIREDDSNGKI